MAWLSRVYGGVGGTFPHAVVGIESVNLVGILRVGSSKSKGKSRSPSGMTSKKNNCNCNFSCTCNCNCNCTCDCKYKCNCKKSNGKYNGNSNGNSNGRIGSGFCWEGEGYVEAALGVFGVFASGGGYDYVLAVVDRVGGWGGEACVGHLVLPKELSGSGV